MNPTARPNESYVYKRLLNLGLEQTLDQMLMKLVNPCLRTEMGLAQFAEALA